MSLDTSLFLFIQSFTGNHLIDSTALFLAEYLVFLVPVSIVYLWFESRDSRMDSLFTFFTTVTGISLTYLLGVFYFHHQPFSSYETIVAGEELNNAFPSQHTASVFSSFWSFLYLEREKLAALMGTAAVLTGFTRVFVGLHYPVDILGGAVSGLLGLGIIALIFPQVSDLLEKLIRRFELGLYYQGEVEEQPN